LNIALGKGRITSPSTSMASFFGKRYAPSFAVCALSIGGTHGKAAARGDHGTTSIQLPISMSNEAKGG
jgi:hypothetical protein